MEYELLQAVQGIQASLERIADVLESASEHDKVVVEPKLTDPNKDYSAQLNLYNIVIGTDVPKDADIYKQIRCLEYAGLDFTVLSRNNPKELVLAVQDLMEWHYTLEGKLKV